MSPGKKRKNAEGYEQFTRKDGSKDWRPVVKPAAIGKAPSGSPSGDFGQDESHIDPQLEKIIDYGYWNDRVKVVEQGYALDRLVHDHAHLMREAVAKQGYGLKELIDDESDSVRKSVAWQGYGLDVLVDDESERVRVEVARQGYGLDQLENDPDWEVQHAVKMRRQEEAEKNS